MRLFLRVGCLLGVFCGFGSLAWGAEAYPAFGEIERIEDGFDDLVSEDAVMAVVAAGFSWSEGPVWDFEESHLLFSDVPENVVYRWREGEAVSRFLLPSGFTGELYQGREPGSNGLTFDEQGRLTLCQHGDRRVARLNERGWGFETVVARWEGQRFNSPNDLCFAEDGSLFFTDPPYGADPEVPSELAFSGVYQVSGDGEARLLSRRLERPNGIGLSPDGSVLYVSNTYKANPVILAFRRQAEGSFAEGSVFFDGRDLVERGLPGSFDGMALDEQGNVWASAPGGVVVLDAEGRLLGHLKTNRPTANCAFGGNDGTTLFITAGSFVLRLETRVRGYFPFR